MADSSQPSSPVASPPSPLSQPSEAGVSNISLLLTQLTHSDPVIRQRALSSLLSPPPTHTSSTLLPTLASFLASLDPTDDTSLPAFQALPSILSSLSTSAFDTQRADTINLLSSLTGKLQLPPLYTEMDGLRQQNLPVPAPQQRQHAAFAANAGSILQSMLSLIPPSAALPSTLRVELLLALMAHSFRLPANFHRKYPAAALALLAPEWLSSDNAACALALQRRLLPEAEGGPEMADEEVEGALYEGVLPALLKRLRQRMGGKEGEWKQDVSTPFVVFHCLSHLTLTRPSTPALLHERVHDVVPLLLPLLNDWLDRSRVLGSVLLSHLLSLLPFGALSAFAPLLQHTLDVLQTDRDSAAIHVVVSVAIDLLLSTVPPFPVATEREEEERMAGRLKSFAAFLASLTFLSLSSSAQVALVRLHAEQLLRLLLWMHLDVLPQMGAVLELLWRLGSYWDEGVRERAWVAVGWVVEVGGRAVKRRSGEVMERLMEAEVEALRQAELGDRTAAFVTEDMKDAPFVVEARERSASWRRTAVQIAELKAALLRRWPAHMRSWREVLEQAAEPVT